MTKARKPILLLLVLLASMALLNGCIVVGSGPGHVRGNHNIETRDYAPGDFAGLDIRGGVELRYVKGDSCSVTLETDENLHEEIDIRVNGDILRVDSSRNISPTRCILTITAPTLQSVDCSGAVEFDFTDAIETDRLDLKISGACDGTMKVEATTIRAEISGASDMGFSGSCEDFRLSLSGAGSVDARDLVTKKAEMEISGAGSMTITCEEALEARVSGAGSITYYGDPEVNKRVSGAGSVRKG